MQGNKGNTATSAEDFYFEMGLLNLSDRTVKWIEMGTDNMPAPSKYTIELDVNIINDGAGIMFAGKDLNNYLMWQLDTYYGETRFRPHQ